MTANPSGPEGASSTTDQTAEARWPVRRWQSLRFQLPALVSALLLVVVGVLGWTAYRYLEDALRVSEGQRLRGVASIFADLFRQSAQQGIVETDRLAGDPVVADFLRHLHPHPDPDPRSRRAAVARLTPASTSYDLSAVELSDSAGRCVLRVGGLSTGGTHDADTGCPGVSTAVQTLNALGPSPIQIAGDVVFFQTASAVRDSSSGSPLGRVVESRRLGLTPLMLVTRLVREDARLRLGNRSGGIWTDLTRAVAGPPIHEPTSEATVFPDTDGSRRLGWAVAVEGTPWLLWVGVPEALVLAPAGRLLPRLAGLGLVITLGGVIAGTLVTRRLTAPLRAVTKTADAMARGDYTARVPVLGGDELGDLAMSFNTMAGRVAETQRLLEKQLDQRTAELEHRVRLEDELRGREERFRLLIENLSEVIAVLDANCVITYVGPSVERVLGYTSADLVGRPCGDLVHPEARATLAELITVGRRSEEGAVPPVLQFGHQNGSWRLMEVTTSDLHTHEAIGGVVLTARDVTERVTLEQQLRQAQKLEAIGSLAGGIAHDFNNLLTMILGYTELLLDDPAERWTDGLLEVKKAAERAAALTHQLLAFSRKQVLEPKVLELNAVIRNVEPMLQRVISEDIRVVTVLGPNLSRVKADPGQLEQVIVNLVLNARDAMPNGGQLTIETLNVALDEAYAREHVSVTPGRYVQLVVSDTGVGMDRETQARVFEPFFTTKGPGKGTGLGLATVYGIVKQSGGNVWLYSEPGRGATFKVYLPAVDEPTAGAEIAPEGSARGTETILVAEDEQGLRRLIVRILEALGYLVLEAPTPAEAIALSERKSGPIDLLLTDVVMPHMSGSELCARVAAGRPAIRVLYISGYADDAVVRHGVLEATAAFLQKPFTPQALAAKVRQVLDQRRSGGRHQI